MVADSNVSRQGIEHPFCKLCIKIGINFLCIRIGIRFRIGNGKVSV